jgi:nucleotide-binding universal stress UspA family protein
VNMIENILFPVDFSPSCVAIGAYVKRAAAIFGSRVTLLHVCDLASHNGFELYLRSLQEIAEEHWNIARRKIDSFLESEFPLTKCPRVVRSGDAAEQIAEVASTGAFDLIIMPTHAGRFRRMLLGSTTAKVLNDADCLVMTTEHAEVIAPRSLEHREWVCAVDLSGDSKRVLDLANRAAATAGARLSLIHVIQNSGSAAEHRRDEEKARQSIGELQKSIGCEAMLRVIRGPIKEAILDAAQQFGADVLIIGRPQSKVLGRMRDLTYGLVRDSPFPVLSV